MGPCPCGRTAPRVRCIGRTDDMLIVRGINLFPSAGVRSALNVKTLVELVPEGTLKRPDHVKVALIERVHG